MPATKPRPPVPVQPTTTTQIKMDPFVGNAPPFGPEDAP